MSKISKIYSAGILVIGNEILSGRTQDTNTSWIAQRLVEHGVRVVEARIIPDIEDVIIKSLNEMKGRMDYVFTTGGIGPTHDDITTESIAKACGLKAEINAEASKLLEEYYKDGDYTSARQKMAVIPQGARLINNPVSAAPGFNVENIYVMAGVPKIMQAMLDHVIEMIDMGDPLLSLTVSCGLPESILAPDLAILQIDNPEIEIGSYPHYRGGVLGLSIVARGTDKEILEDVNAKIIDLIKKHGDTPRAVGVRDEEISKVIDIDFV